MSRETRETNVLTKPMPRSKKTIFKNHIHAEPKEQVRTSSIFLNDFEYLCFDSSCVDYSLLTEDNLTCLSSKSLFEDEGRKGPHFLLLRTFINV